MAAPTRPETMATATRRMDEEDRVNERKLRDAAETEEAWRSVGDENKWYECECECECDWTRTYECRAFRTLFAPRGQAEPWVNSDS